MFRFCLHFCLLHFTLFLQCSIDQFITRLTASLYGYTDGITASLFDGEQQKSNDDNDNDNNNNNNNNNNNTVGITMIMMIIGIELCL